MLGLQSAFKDSPMRPLFQRVKERLGTADRGRALAWPKAWAPFPAQEEAEGRKSLKRPHRRGLEKGQRQVATSARLTITIPCNGLHYHSPTP